MLRVYDLNNDNQVEPQEYLRFFKAYDDNNDGYLEGIEIPLYGK